MDLLDRTGDKLEVIWCAAVRVASHGGRPELAAAPGNDRHDGDTQRRALTLVILPPRILAIDLEKKVEFAGTVR